MSANQEMKYNADVEQSVELILKRTTKEKKVVKNRVTHIFRPMTDEEFFQYEQKKNIVQKISGKEILNVRTQDKSLAAAQWLWDTLATGRTGYVQREDWKEKTDLLDKQTAIVKGLLAVFPADDTETDIFDDAVLSEEIVEDDEEFSDDLVDEDEQTVVRLDVLFNCVPMRTTHYFNAPSAKDVSDYAQLMKKASNTLDGRKGFRQKKGSQTSQVSIPSKARELCALYDRLIINTEGYDGRVPAHHKREAILEVFSRDVDVTEKNS